MNRNANGYFSLQVLETSLPKTCKYISSGCTSAYVEQSGGVTWHSVWLTELFCAVRVRDKAITQHIIPALILERPFSSTISGERLSPPINQKELFSLSLKPPETHGHPHLCLTKAHKPHLHPSALRLAANPKPCTVSISFSFHSFVLFQFSKHCFIGIQKHPPRALNGEFWKRNFIKGITG